MTEFPPDSAIQNHQIFVRQSRDPALVLDARGSLLHANWQAAELLGCPTQSLPDHSIRDFVPAEEYPALAQMFAALQSRGSLVFLWQIKRCDGQPIPVEVQARAAGNAIQLTLRAETGSLPARETLQRSTAILSAASQAVGRLLLSADWRAEITPVLGLLGTAAGVSRLSVYEFQPDPSGQLSAQIRHEWLNRGIPSLENYPQSETLGLRTPGWPAVREILLRGESFQAFRKNMPAFAPDDARALLMLPVRVDGTWWGLFCLENCLSEQAWEPAEQDALGKAAASIGALLVQRRRMFALGASEERYRMLVENQGDGICLVDAHEYVRYANAETDAIFGVPPGGLIGRNLVEFLDEEQVARLYSQTRRRQEGYRGRYELEIRRADGTRRSLLVTATPHTDENGEFTGSFGTFHDITERRNAEIKIQQLLEAERAARSQTENLRQAASALVADLDLDQVLERVLEGMQQVVPYQSCTVFLYESGILRAVAARGFEVVRQTLFERVPSDEHFFKLTRESGSPVILQDAASDPHFEWWSEGPPARGWMCVPMFWHQQAIGFMTIDSSRPGAYGENEAELALAFANQAALAIQNSRLYAEADRLARTDPLTGLYNRRSLFEMGQREFDRARRYKRPFSVIIFDMDDFKSVNDTYGHVAGDRALLEITARMRTLLRQTDILGRYGGDEFVAILLETDLETGCTAVTRLRESFENDPVKLNGQQLGVTVSMGIATLEDDHTTLDDLFAHADQALYRAKHLGRNTLQVWRAGSIQDAAC